MGLDLVCTVSLMSLCALFIREGEEVVIYPVHVNFSLYFKTLVVLFILSFVIYHSFAVKTAVNTSFKWEGVLLFSRKIFASAFKGNQLFIKTQFM